LALKFLNEVDSIFMDGTFKSCPKILTQFFTILLQSMSLKKNNYIPLVFFFPNKNIETYITAFTQFSLLKSEFLKTNIHFSLEKIFIDFEKAIHSSLCGHQF
jgi:hypothetical protein